MSENAKKTEKYRWQNKTLRKNANWRNKRNSKKKSKSFLKIKKRLRLRGNRIVTP